MGRRWYPFAVLAVLVLPCLCLSLLTAWVREVNLRSLDEVTAVVDGSRPGAVVVRTQGDSGTRFWLVDDAGEAAGFARATDEVPAGPGTEDCAGTVCYRVAGTAMRVEASGDGGGTYSVAWEISRADYAVLAGSYPEVGNPAEHLSSRSVVVHPVAGGHVVFVANGRDGLLYRDVRGGWHRRGFPNSGEGCCFYDPPVRLASEPQPLDLTGYAVAAVLLAVLLSGGITAIVRRRLPWTGALALIVLAALAAYGTGLAGHFPTVGMFPGFIYGVPLILAILALSAPLAVWFASGPAATKPSAAPYDYRRGRSGNRS